MAIGLFTLTRSNGARLAALGLVSVPFLAIAGSGAKSMLAQYIGYQVRTGRYAFRDARMREIALAIYEGNARRVRGLAAKEVVNRPGQEGKTLLLFAMENRGPRRLATIEALLAARADPNAADERSNRPLALAVYGDAALVRRQMKADADPNLLSPFGEPIYFQALEHLNDPEVLPALFEAKIDEEAKSTTGTPAVEVAAGNGQWAAVRLLLERGAPPTDELARFVREAGGKPESPPDYAVVRDLLAKKR